MTGPIGASAIMPPSGAAAYRVRSTRALLFAALLASGLLRALAAALSVLALAAVADLMAPLPLALRQSVIPAALASGGAGLAWTLWRGRGIRSLNNVALWVEERIPWLHYALVTSVDPRFGDAHRTLEPVVGEAQWGGIIATTWWRAVRLPLAMVLAAMAVLILVPDATATRAIRPQPGDSVLRPAAGAAANPLEALAATVVPPSYSGLPTERYDNPQRLAALTGSRITVQGSGNSSDLVGLAGSDRLAVRARDGGWQFTLLMPATPTVVRLAAGGEVRLITLEPRTDAEPVVRLHQPARDSVIRVPTGIIALEADASDDFGLAHAAFELIVSSGQGESFSFRAMTIGTRQLRGDRTARLRASIPLDSLALVGGDVLHIRAVARDGNTVTGPAEGASETRTLRIPRPGEYDSVAVEGAPPPEVDKSLLSQRMLIIAAERLHARRTSLERPAMLRESRGIASDQARLRKRVGEIVFIRLEGEDTGEHAHGPGDGHDHGPAGLETMTPEQVLAAAEAATAHDGDEPLDFAEGESPVVNVNRPLLEAYNAMWQAGGELEQGDPGRALPHMRAALEALQRARAAERYYLRGRPPTVVIDLESVRMQGTERGSPAPRESRAAAPDGAAARARRFQATLAMLTSDPSAATDSLVMLRIDALGVAPTFAAALGDAIDALRTGRDATAPLVRARRAVGGEPSARSTLPVWGAGW